METARCPGCGASVRPGAAWCSLCYLDLRPKPSQVVSPRSAPASLSAPLVVAVPDAAVVALRSDILEAEVVDAEVGAAERGPAPESGSPAVVSAPRWPCSCGELVPIEQNECPACGSAFLGELSSTGNGRHRAATGSGLHWPASRGARLALAGLIAVLIAVSVPLLLAVMG